MLPVVLPHSKQAGIQMAVVCARACLHKEFILHHKKTPLCSSCRPPSGIVLPCTWEVEHAQSLTPLLLYDPHSWTQGLIQARIMKQKP